MNNLAMVLHDQKRFQEAEETYRQVFMNIEMLQDYEMPLAVFCRSNLAMVLQQQGKNEEAREMTLRAIEESEKLWDDDDPNRLKPLNNLGGVT